jgi:hypothetical protein
LAEIDFPGIFSHMIDNSQSLVVENMPFHSFSAGAFRRLKQSIRQAACSE